MSTVQPPPREPAARRRLRLGLLGELIRHVRWLLGARQRWIIALPILSVAAAACEVLLLVTIVRSLLLLVNEKGSTQISLGPFGGSISSHGLLWLALGASLASIALRAADGVVVGRLAARAATTARSRLIQSYFAADWRAMARLRSGRLQQLLGTNIQMASNAVPLLGTTLSSLINLAVYGAFVLVASPVVGAIFAVLGGVVVSAFSLLRRRTSLVAQASQRDARDIQLTATTLSTLNRELQLFDVQGAATSQLEDLNSRARRSMGVLRTLQRIIPTLFQQTVLLAVVGLVLVARHLDIDASSFGTAAILALRSLSYLQQLNTATQSYVETAPYLDEIADAIAEHHDEARVRGDLELDAVRSMVLDKVGFDYGDGPVLEDISLDLHPGDWLGVVGPSGSGKTTLANILAGLLQPDRGSYEVNGREARAFSAGSWASRFALLSQEPALIRGTLGENVRFFRPGSDAEVELAAQKAAIASDISLLPQGWETRVGEGESSLSGGQRQRVALARALFGGPSVLILDEPTSALDAESSRLIEQSLVELGPEVIAVVVSHRPALLERCTRFVVIEDGRIKEQGSRSDVSLERYVGAMQPLAEAEEL